MKTTLSLLAALTAFTTDAFAQLGFLFEPEDTSASPGAQVLFLGTAYGAEPIEYQWRKDGTNLVGQNADYLYLPNVRSSDAGGYDVVASTSAGAITSRVAVLTVSTWFTKITGDPLVNEGGNSGGSAWGDFDNDGDLDVFVIHLGTDFNSLFRNDGGVFTKLDLGPVTTDFANSTVATWADYDNDGWLDLLVNNSGNNTPQFLYHNEGDGTFRRVTNGIGGDIGTVQMAAWADYNADGWLDLVTGPMGGFGGAAGGLYRNNAGTLTRVTNNLVNGFTLFFAQSVAWSDYDGDRDIDLFFATSRAGNFAPGNEVLLNNSAGTFVQAGSGALVSSPSSSTTASWADFDGDGDLDVYVGNVDGETKFLFRNDGTNFAQVLGETATEEGATEGSAWADFDNDGWLDLFVANNMGTGNHLFRNQGDGTFEKIDTGSLTGDRANSTSASWVDINNDGALDLFVTNLGENNFLYRNNLTNHAWLSVRLRGVRSNRSGVGAKVRILATINGVTRWQMREIAVRDSSGSPSSLRAEFGLGDAEIVQSLRVEWPSGLVSELSDVPARQFLEVSEPPTIFANDAEIIEGDSGTRELLFNVSLTEPSTNIVTVNFTTTNGTAIAGTHYVATNGALAFAPGETNRALAVPVIGNLDDDGDRDFTLLFTNSENMALWTRSVVGTIRDDDPLTLNIDNNLLITEGDTGTTNLIFNIALNKPWTSPVSMHFFTRNGSATAGADYLATNGVVVLEPGEVSKPLPIAVLGDTLSETNETLLVDFTNVVGVAASALVRRFATILDNDPLPVLSFNSPRQLERNAGATQLVFTASLSAPAGRNVSFNYATTNGTATAPADYTARSGSITLTAGVVATNIAITISADMLVEGEETLGLNLSNPLWLTFATNRAFGVIVDDDFRMASPRFNVTNATLSFHSVSNRPHRVEWAPSLTPPVQWSTVPGAEMLLGHGGVLSVSDAAAGASNRFYRVLLLP